MIQREEMQEIARGYSKPLPLILGSHSALDIMDGARAFGMKKLVYAPQERAKIYLRHPIVGAPGEKIEDLPATVRRDLLVVEDPKDIDPRGSWRTCILIVDRYEDILKSEYTDRFLELEAIQVPNRAFAVYVGGYACKKIEDDFPVPIFGSRQLLKIENREEVQKNYYYLLEKSGIPHPEEFRYEVTGQGIRFKSEVKQPLVLKVPHAVRRLERGFLFASDGKELERKVGDAVKQGMIDPADLKEGRAEEYVPGVTANLNFFASPLDRAADMGKLGKYYDGALGTQFISVDMRYETTHDGISRMHAKDQIKCDWSQSRYRETFEVVAHGLESLRESLLRLIYPIADKFEKACLDIYKEPMIGAYCVQTLITFREKPLVKGASVGVYDVAEGKKVTDFEFVCQDIATRLGGGTNCAIGIGGQYGNTLYNQGGFSMGKRMALEMKRATEKKMLDQIVT